MGQADRREHEALEELAELAALGVLDPEGRRRLSEHLRRGCAACEKRTARAQETLDLLALATPDAVPARGAREALLASLAPERNVRRRRTPGLAALAAGVALVLAAGALVTAQRIRSDARDAVRLARERIEAQLVERDERIEALSGRLARFEEALQTTGVSEARALTLAGEASFVSANARVVVDPTGHQVLLLASRLPPAPPGHTYQLWIIVSGAPRSLGVFDPDEGGRALHVESGPFELADEFRVAVSVEPSGGVPQPTGPIVLASH